MIQWNYFLLHDFILIQLFIYWFRFIILLLIFFLHENVFIVCKYCMACCMMHDFDLRERPCGVERK